MTKQELAECIDTYGRDIYSFCRYLAGTVQEADELYQDTWLRVVERLERVDSAGNVKSYCLSMAVGIWKNKKRKFAWRKRIVGSQACLEDERGEILCDPSLPLEERILGEEQSRLVRKAVCELPQKLKTVTLLYYMEDLSTAQIAEVLKVSAGTVKSRLYHARLLLKKKLEVVLDEE
ncbi:MAG: RNA polymerase sigma factor [Ruminococcus flavefaciens]|nr:RNA polymerase sigma factor [Ruminococcus flavefaciens]